MNNAVNQSVGDTPFRLNYGQNPHTPLSIKARSQVPAAHDFVEARREAIARAKVAMQSAQDRMAYYHNQGRRPQEFTVGQEVLLRTTNLPFKGTVASKGGGQRLTRKLLPKWVGPFKVLQRVGELAYRLELPETVSIHPVFHTELLKPWRASDRHQPPPAPILVDGIDEYVVEAIASHRLVKRGRKPPAKEYLVRWEGYGPEAATWEPEESVADTQALEEYEALLVSRDAPPGSTSPYGRPVTGMTQSEQTTLQGQMVTGVLDQGGAE
jgi:hypothetical protein